MRLAALALALSPAACGWLSPSEPPAFFFEAPPEADPRPPRGLPGPPMQRAPWTAPETSLPPTLVSAAGDLFDAGLADPRGCEYREIEIEIGSVWSGAWRRRGERFKTRGWVLPASPSAPRFAVGWNGNLYEVEEIGEKADLEADVVALAEAEETDQRTQQARSPGSRYWRPFSALEEEESAAHDKIHALMAPLLLRLGEARLAERTWKAWVGPSKLGERAGTSDRDFHPKDPYLLFATEWLWAMFDRALTAHMRGDDALSLATLQALEPSALAVEKRAGERGVSLAGLPEAGGTFRYLDFLEPTMRKLRRDQARRARGPRRLSPRPGSLANDSFPRFARAYVELGATMALVELLETASARQGGQPGFVDLGEDAIVKALADSPSPGATAALADALEKDTRLTRSVHFHRNFHFHRSILGAHEAALAALEKRLGASFFHAEATGDDLSGRGPEGREAAAERVRAHLAR